MKTTGVFLISVLLGLVPAAVHAERYRVDLILFSDKTGSGAERPTPARPTELERVFDLADGNGLRNAGIEILPDEAFGLAKEWRHLANSQRHQPLLKLAWIQKDPPADKAPGLRLRSGTPSTLNSNGRSTELYPIDGSVRLLLGRFLHLDADMAYTVSLGDTGEYASYRLKERRRMRRDELHHIDSPRLGILARVQRADQPAKK